MRPDGIAGLEGREPVGAVLTIGTKGPKGNPTATDRLYIKQPMADDNNERPDHPSYTAWNKAPAERRTVIRGNLIHASFADAFEYHLQAYKLPGVAATPNRAPHCVGDGEKAQRWNGTEFRQIVCPNEKCEFRQGEKKPCGAWMRFLFRPRWFESTADGAPIPEDRRLPSMVFKFTSKGWDTTRNFVGFRDQVMKQAAAMEIANVNLIGFPIVLTLAYKSQPQKKQRFPVLSVNADGDITAFLLAQLETRNRLATIPRAIAITDESQQRPEVIATDYQTVVPGQPFAPRDIFEEKEQ